MAFSGKPSIVNSLLYWDGTKFVSSTVNNFLSAAGPISGSNVTPNFGSQSIITTGTLSSGAITAPSLDYSGALSLGATNATSIIIGSSGSSATIYNATFAGTTTIINSTDLYVYDRNIHLNESTGIVPVPTQISGVLVHRGSPDGYILRDHAALVWDESNSTWRASFNTSGDGYTVGANQSFIALTLGVGTGSSPPSISSGAGGPGSSPSNGSIYLRTDGTSSTGLYTYQSGSWTTLSATPVGSAGGDLSGSYPNPTVIKINGNSVKSETLTSSQDGYALTWINADGYWESSALSGDVSGKITNNTVAKINGSTVPAGGALTTGNVLQVSGSSALTYGAVNLAGGANYVTGVLPAVNQAAQTMGGDVSGTTSSATVTKIQGRSVSSTAPSDGYILGWVAANNDWEPKQPSSIITSGRTLQFANVSSDISGYLTLKEVSSLTEVDLTASVSSGSGQVLIKEFATSVGSPNVLLIPAGVWNFNYWRYVDSTNGTTTITFKVYTRTAGGSETLLFSVDSQTITDTSVAYESVSYSYSSDTIIAATDRIVIKVYCQTTSNPTRTVHFVFEDNLRPSHTHTPIVGGALSVGGDLTGVTSNATVARIRGNSVAAQSLGSSQDGYVLTWVNANSDWEAKPSAGGGGGSPTGSAGGDLSGTYPNPTVAKINATTITTAGGALTTGKVLRVTGVSSADWGALDLSNSSAITGTLPTGNQAAQSLGGDLSGTTSSGTVIKINATSVPSSPTANQILVATSGTTSIWSQIYDGYIAPAANIAVSKLAAGTSAQILLNNSTPTPTWTTVSGDAVISNTGATTVQAIRGKTLASSLSSVGASQDGYALTWVDANGDWEARPTVTTGSISGWTTLFDIDLTSLGTQTMSTDTTYVVGGYSWIKSNSAKDSVAAGFDGTGLTFTPVAASDWNNTITSPLVALDIASLIPNYDQRMNIRAWFYISSFNGAANYDNAIMLVGTGADASYDFGLKRGWGTGGVGSAALWTSNAVNTSGYLTDTYTPGTSNNVIVIETLRGDFPAFRTYRGAYSSGWPTSSSLTFQLAYHASGSTTLSGYQGKTFKIGMGAQRANSGTALVVKFARVRVDYRLT